MQSEETTTMGGFYSRVEAGLAAVRLSKLARAVKRQHLTYLSYAKLRRLEDALDDAVTSGVEGAFLEFGVALGGSAILIAEAAQRAGERFAGFDVFGMIPPPASEKDDAQSKARYVTIASGKAAGIGGETYYGYREKLYDDVVAAFARNGLTVDGNRIALVKGLFEETWPSAGIRAVAFCHIDCDWYDPVRFCLDRVAPLLSSGGTIILDDYHDYGGCRLAADEFLASHPEFELHDGPNVTLRRRGIGAGLQRADASLPRTATVG
jgi:asparagine synthase (glutamine-hydrolysing)